jgi:chromosome segregation ATPase
MRIVELQELHAGLQELWVTVRQVGGEVTGRLHDKVQAAEATLERLEAVLKDLRPELEGLQALSREVDSEREHLEAKRASLKSAREPAPAPPVAEAPGTVRRKRKKKKNLVRCPLADGEG